MRLVFWIGSCDRKLARIWASVPFGALKASSSSETVNNFKVFQLPTACARASEAVYYCPPASCPTLCDIVSNLLRRFPRFKNLRGTTNKLYFAHSPSQQQTPFSSALAFSLPNPLSTTITSFYNTRRNGVQRRRRSG